MKGTMNCVMITALIGMLAVWTGCGKKGETSADKGTGTIVFSGIC